MAWLAAHGGGHPNDCDPAERRHSETVTRTGLEQQETTAVAAAVTR